MNYKLSQYLDRWYRDGAGVFFAAQLEKQLESILGHVFGYHAIQLGNYPPGVDLLKHSRVRLNIHAGRSSADVLCEAEALPFESDSVDLVVLPHALELSNQPHALLREVDRVLVPEAHLIVIGVNPWSIWGGWQWLRYRRRYPFYTPGRVCDWLSLLGFAYLEHHSARLGTKELVMPGRFGEKAWVRALGLRLGRVLAGGYVLVAKKKVSTLTPVRPQWNQKPRLVSVGLTEPSARGVRKNVPED
jgi:SAM-dependent methyltransferase